MKRHGFFQPNHAIRFQARESFVIILYEPPFAEGEHEANAATAPPWESLAQDFSRKEMPVWPRHPD